MPARSDASELSECKEGNSAAAWHRRKLRVLEGEGKTELIVSCQASAKKGKNSLNVAF